MLVLNGAVRAIARSRPRARRIFAMRAAKLQHEAADDAVKVEAIVKATLGELHEIACSNGHLVDEKFDFDLPKGGIEERNGVCHARHGKRADASWEDADDKRFGACPSNRMSV